MPKIPPELHARMVEYAEHAADDAPELTEEQIRHLRAALRMTGTARDGGPPGRPEPN